MFSLISSTNDALILDTFQQGTLRIKINFTNWSSHLRWSVSVNDAEFEEQDSSPEIDLATYIDTAPDVSVAWWQALSEQIRTNVKLFGNGSARMLQLASRYPSVLELLGSRPVLIALLKEAVNEESEWVAMTALPQRKILNQLNVPSTKGILKQLDKYQTDEFRPSFLRELLQFYRQPANQHLFCHETAVKDWMVPVAIAHPWLVSTRFWKALCNKQMRYRKKRLINLIDDSVLMGVAREVDDPQRTIGELSGFLALQALHDRWVVLSNAAKIEDIPEEEYRVLFKSPPIPGNADIVPIVNLGMLSEEGLLMSHCIRSYKKRILHGEYYAYRILQPQRATLGIRIDQRNNEPALQLEQLRGLYNASVGNEVTEAVRRWFNQ